MLVAEADMQWKLVSGIHRGNVFTKNLDVNWSQTISIAHPILATCTKPHEIWIYIWKRNKNYMQINLLNMYNQDILTYILWDIRKRVTLLSELYSYWFSWIVQARQGSNVEIERKASNINNRKTIINPHIWEHYTI